MRTLRILLGLLAFVLAGCAGTRSDTAFAPTYPDPLDQVAPPTDGAIFNVNAGRDLFADHKARNVGDVLTIILNERTQASKSSSTKTAKDDSVDIGAPILLGKELAVGGRPATVGLNGQRAFDGSGESSQSNQLSGQITVTVVRRLSNGALLVRGQKWLHINQGQELVQISGMVRPEDIGQDNTVASTRVADARIAYTGKGALADANAQGWLSRFFSSVFMPF